MPAWAIEIRDPKTNGRIQSTDYGPLEYDLALGKGGQTYADVDEAQKVVLKKDFKTRPRAPARPGSGCADRWLKDFVRADPFLQI